MAEAGEQSAKTLPEALVETILARVPFPFVFKARLLSKSWLARLSPISSQDPEAKRLQVSLFHKELRQWSTTWMTFCPVLWNGEDLIAYDRTTHSRVRLPSLSLPPVSEAANHLQRLDVLAIDGALVLVSRQNILHVSNIVARSWKVLPLRPRTRPPAPPIGNTSEKAYLSQTAETYKVIIVSDHHHVYIYDASSDGWTDLNLDVGLLDPPVLSSVAHEDGVLYLVASLLGSFIVVAANTKDLVLREFSIRRGERDLFRMDTALLRMDTAICNANLLIIVETEHGGKKVLKIDLGSQRLLTVAPFDHPRNPRLSYMSYVTDDRYLFFAVQADGSLLKAYDVHDENYCWLRYDRDTSDIAMHVGRWIPSSFRPGLNLCCRVISRSVNHGSASAV